MLGFIGYSLKWFRVFKLRLFLEGYFSIDFFRYPFNYKYLPTNLAHIEIPLKIVQYCTSPLLSKSSQKHHLFNCYQFIANYILISRKRVRKTNNSLFSNSSFIPARKKNSSKTVVRN